MLALDLRDSSQVAEARRAAVGLAQAHGFDEEDAGRVALVVTELATNLLKHGGGGTLLVGSYEDATGAGIECVALDKGPGMADVGASMRDGHSTAGSPGTGLGAVARGSQVMDVYSAPGLGTAILARIAPGRAAAEPRPAADHGGVSVAVAGEEACGDAWCWKVEDAGFVLMVADGLGHGSSAAEAAHAATRAFTRRGEAPPSDLLAVLHDALRSTRGAAVGIARYERAAGQVVFAGVGNIAATLVDAGGEVRRMVSHNGTIGHVARKMRDFTYPVGPGALLVLASDGIGTSWRLDDYPGLATRHPTLIAGVLFRDFRRLRDDATVVVARIGAE